MYMHARTLGWLIQRGTIHRHFSFRRMAYASGFGLTHALLASTVSAARWLDEQLYPEFEQLPAPAPVFVLATPRSGTTYLHQLLALDEERFTTPKLYQTIAPSIVLERTLDWLGRLEGPAGRGLGSLVDAVDRRMFTDWDGIHRVSLKSMEEDESLFVYNLATPALYLLFPFVEKLPELGEVTRLGEHAVRGMARDYVATLRRWAYLARDERVPLIKNVLLASRLPVADLAFPDARYVHVVRDPRDAVPSALSMFYAMWQTHSPDIARDSAETRALADLFLEHYRLLCAERHRRPPDRWVTVQYDALVREPVATLEKLYAALGFPMTETYRARLEQAARRARSFKSQHRYELDDYGLSETYLRERLAECWDEVAPSTKTNAIALP
jgi:LPS sulfotransferase NodH